MTDDEMQHHHSAEYIQFLKTTRPHTATAAQKKTFGMDADCPVIDSLYKYCEMYSGATWRAAQELNDKQYDIAINRSGGLHHAKQDKASGIPCRTRSVVYGLLACSVHVAVLT